MDTLTSMYRALFCSCREQNKFAFRRRTKIPVLVQTPCCTGCLFIKQTNNDSYKNFTIWMRVPSSEAQDEPYFDFILNDNAQVLARALILCILYAARNKECVCV